MGRSREMVELTDHFLPGHLTSFLTFNFLIRNKKQIGGYGCRCQCTCEDYKPVSYTVWHIIHAQ